MRFSKEKIFVGALFLLLTFLSLKVKFHRIFGTDMSFKYFNFFAPVNSSIFGPLLGALLVLLVQLVNLALNPNLSLFRIFLLAPMFLATYVFGRALKKERWHLALFPVFIFLFLIHPIGAKAWKYTLLWLLPLVPYLLRLKLFPAAFSTVMLDHALGSLVFLYLYPSPIPPNVWIMVIPLTIMERVLMSFGLLLNCALVTHALRYAETALNVRLLHEPAGS